MRTATSPTERDGQAGFTLFELLAVLAILAIALSAFTFGSSTSLETAKFRAMLVNTSAALDEARISAIRQMKEKVFLVDMRNGRMGIAGGKDNVRILPGVGLKATVAESEKQDDDVVGIRFYPAGTSSGGILAFTRNARTYEVRVNWLTGHVSLQGP